MVKYDHDWNSHIATWESDGRVFKERPKRKTRLMELFALDFLRFDGPDPDRTQLRGKVGVEYDEEFHTVYSSEDRFRTVRLGRFDALTGGDFSQGGRPINAEYDVLIHTHLEDKTHGELFLLKTNEYEKLERLGVNFKQERDKFNNEIIWNTGQQGLPDKHRTYDSLCRSQLAGPYCAVDVLFAVYRDAVGATVQLTFLDSNKEEDSDLDVRADVCGTVTARNTLLADPDAYSTLFARTTYDFASLLPGDSIPLSKPSVLVPATSSLLLDLDLEYRVPSSPGSSHNFLKSKSSFQVPASQHFQTFVHIISPDADCAIAMLKVEVKWLEF